MMRRVFLILVAGTMGMSLARAEEPRVTFPRDYTETFTNYLSLDRVQNPDQIIRLFANELAIGAGCRKGPSSWGRSTQRARMPRATSP